MKRKKKSDGKSLSRKQQRLMGMAYSCASGKSENCPLSVMKVADSFLKKKTGLKKLKSFASTKHRGLPEIKENLIMKFEDFNLHQDDVVGFLYSLKNEELNGLINELNTTNIKLEVEEIIEEILNLINNKVSGEKLEWVKNELHSLFKK